MQPEPVHVQSALFAHLNSAVIVTCTTQEALIVACFLVLEACQSANARESEILIFPVGVNSPRLFGLLMDISYTQVQCNSIKDTFVDGFPIEAGHEKMRSMSSSRGINMTSLIRTIVISN